MENIHHKAIKRFKLDGTIYDDSYLPRLKEQYLDLLGSEMKLSGFVPRLDIDADFTIEYNEKSKYFTFRISKYGTYVGKRKAQWIEGIDGTTVIRTPQSRLNEFLRAAASQ
jgi:hypothetical protein